MNETVVYSGRDLEAMCFATNYHRTIWEIFKPYLGSRVVEVGAGSGDFSELILEHDSESLSLVEPSPKMYQLLLQRVAESKSRAHVKTYNSLFRAVADEIKSAHRPDSIIYINVLEHIAHDVDEIEAVYRTLDTGGKMFVFVPALPCLYGSYDRQIGHFRRYTRSELEGKCRSHGFRILRSSYFDFTGILPWWIKYCLFRSNTMKPGEVNFYDKHIFPVTRAIESAVRFPVGKNLIIIVEK